MNADELMISRAALSTLMRSMMDNKAAFRFAAKGHSMTPFIRHNDIVTIVPRPDCDPRLGDVVAAHPPWQNDAVVIHRIVSRRGGMYTLKGDNIRQADGAVAANAIVGVVSRVERGGRDVWYAGGLGRRLVALLSASGILAGLLLPLLRGIKRLFNE